MVRVPDRKGLRDGRVLDAELTAGPDGELEHDLPALQALREELVGTEVLERDDLQFRGVLSNARNLEGVEDRDSPVTLLRVEEGIPDRQGDLVAQLGRTDGVAIDQHVGHGRILTRRYMATETTGPRIHSKPWTTRFSAPNG